MDGALDGVAGIVAPEHLRPPRDPEASAVEWIVEPQSAAELAEVVRKCERDRIAIAPLGAARTLSQIRRTSVPLGVSLSRMKRVIAYEPDDMTIVVEAGATLAEIAHVTGERRQRLPVDPCGPAATTVGALIGAAHAGPLRLSEGTTRDLLIGIQLVGHGGRLVHAGGRVVKNVAGYDLMKLMTGSFGTLGIVTEATFKVRPIPEHYAIGVACFERGHEAFAAALGLHDSLALTHLEVATPTFAASLGLGAKFVLLAGVSGNREEIEHQRSVLESILESRVNMVEGEAANRLYEQLRDADLPRATLSARFAVLPAQLPAALAACDAEFVAHAGSGVADLYTARELDQGTASQTVAAWRDAARRARGNLRVLAAAPQIRAALDFFDRPSDGAASLMRRLKLAFDPESIFNPNSFVGGI